MSEPTVTLRIKATSNEATTEIAKVEGGLKRMKGAAKDTEDQAARTSAAWGKAGFVMGTAIAATATAMVVLTGKAINAADQVHKLSEQFGLSSRQISGYGAAAALAGGSIAGFQSALSDLSRAVTGAAGGQKQFRQLFADMGIAVTDAAGEVRGLGELLPEIADKFAQYENGPAKAALATKLFGSAGLELLPFLNQGAAGIEQLRGKAEDLGLVLDDQTTGAAAGFKDNLSELGLVMDGMFNSLARQLLPNLNAFTGALVDNATKSGDSKDSLTGVATIIRSMGKFFLEVARAAEIFGASFAYTIDEVVAEAGVVGDRIEIARTRLTAFAQFLSGNIAGSNLLRSAADEAEKQLENRLARSLASAQEALDDTFAEIDKKYQPLIRAFTGQLADFGNVVSDVTGSALKKGKPPVVEFGGACKIAAEEVKELGIEIQALVDPSAEIIDLLSRTAAEMGGPVAAAALEYRDQLVKIAELQAALLAQGPPTAEAAGQFEALTRAARKAGEDYQTVQAGNMAADEAFLESSQDTAQEWESTWGNAIESISGAVADFATGGIESMRDFVRAATEILRRFLADMIQRFMSTQLRLNVSTTGGSGGSSTFGAGSYGVLGTPTGTAGGLTTLGAAGSMLGGLGVAYAGMQTGNLGYGAAGGAIGAYMLGTGAASLATGALAGTSLASSFATLGAAAGPIGMAIGALIGLIGAYFMQEDPPAIDVIGPGRVGGPGYRNLSPGSTYASGLGGFTFASIDSVDREARDQLAGYIQEFDNTIASFLTQDELTRVTGALSEFQLHLEEGAITAENILGQRWTAILTAFPEDIREMVLAAGELEDQVKKLGELLRFPDAIRGILDQFSEADELAGLTEYERQLRAINDQFDEAREALEAMSATEADLAELETYRANALTRLADVTADTTRQLMDLIGETMFEDSIASLSALGQEQARINRRWDAMRDQAAALGATEEQLAAIERARTRDLEDLTGALVDLDNTLPDIYQPIEQLPSALDAWIDASRRVREFLLGESFSATSTLTPEQMLQEAQRQFSDLLFRAQQGDVGAAGELSGAAQRLLELGRGYYASGDEYDALRNAVLGALTPFGALSTQPQFQLYEAMNALRAAFVNFTQELMRGANLPGQAANSVGYAGGESATVGELRALGTKLDRLERAVSAGADKQASVTREAFKRGMV